MEFPAEACLPEEKKKEFAFFGGLAAENRKK